MIALSRQAVLLVVAGWLSWWLFLRVPPVPGVPRAPREPAPVLRVVPLVEDARIEPGESPAPVPDAARAVEPPAAGPEPEQEAVEREATPPPEEEPPALASVQPSEPEPAAPASELGTPEGREADPLPTAAPDEVAPEPSEPAGPPAPEPPEQRGTAEDAAPPEETGATSSRSSHDLDLPNPPRREPTTPAPTPTLVASEPEPPPPADPAPAPPRTLEPRFSTASQATSSVPDPPAHSARAGAAALMRDPALLAAAREEFSLGNRKGFATVLLAAPEEQIEIARFFGEELVLVPRAALDSSGASPRYYRLSETGKPLVEEVAGAPPLEEHRQYRDLFDYEYARLPSPLRELRRSMVARGEIYLFAALLSAEEWALIIARRSEALARAGRELAEVRRFVLRYVRPPGGGFDLRAEEIVFGDGTRFVPALAGKGND